MKDASGNNVLPLIRKKGSIPRREIESETELSRGAAIIAFDRAPLYSE